MSYILRVRDRFRGISRGYTSKTIGVKEIEYVKNEIILLFQKECFGEEVITLQKGKCVKKGQCRQMQLFIADKGIIRCRSRLSNLMDEEHGKSPVLVNADHPYIKSYIKHTHILNNCSNFHTTFEGFNLPLPVLIN